MSVLAVVDVALSVKTFINIELHTQGWYAVRFCIPTGSDVRAVLPTAVIEPEVGHDRQPTNHAWAIEPGGYRTHVFRIRFCYEEVDISESFILQLYMNAAQDLDSLSCVVDVELLFSESDMTNTKPTPAQFELKPVARESLRISRVVSGAHQHYSCTFDSEHFALANIAVISCLQGFTTAEALDSITRVDRSSRSQRSSRSPSIFKNFSRQGSYSQAVINAISDTMAHSPRAAHASASSSGFSPSPRESLASAPAAAASNAPPWVTAIREESGSGDGGGRGSLLAALQARVAAAISPPVVGCSSKCGPGGPGKVPSLLLCLDQAMDITARTAVETMYDDLVACHQRSIKGLVDFLKALPKSCYAPQSYETVRTLLQSMPDSPQRGGAGSIQHPRGLNALYSAGNTSTAFIKQLPFGCTIGAALQHMEDALRRLRREAAAEWTVVMWVLRACPADMHRYLKCNWELEQPALVESWLFVNTCMSEPEAETSLAATRRMQMRQEWPFEVPQVHSSLFWELAPTHPILLIDDSMAVHRAGAQEPAAAAMTAAAAAGQDPAAALAAAAAGGAVTQAASSPRAGGKMSSNRKDRTETHFVIFVHGFQGNSADLCLVKGHLAMIYPYLECYSSRANENNTSDSIQEMGARLAQEVADAIKPFTAASRRPLTALSFVGHSIGNLILRSALVHPELAPYLPLLHMYISICGPHLGFMYSTNSMLDAGVSVLKSVSSKGKCLHQLSFSDAPKTQDCYLYKLAHQSKLSDFKFVVLVSSTQDRYVPYHSSRVSICSAANKDTKGGPAYKAMAQQLLQGMGEPGKAQLLRIDVDFDFKSKAFSLSNIINNKIGRQAHIEFIESSVYARFLAWTIHKYNILKEVGHTWL